MKYGELNLGQVEAIVNKLGGMEGVQRFLRGELVVSEPPRLAVLAFREGVTAALTRKFIPNEFFTTRPGLYLWNDMQRVLKGAQPAVEQAETAKLSSFDLTKNAHDNEIRGELPKNHEVELWQIAELIEAQKNGKAGPLLNNGRANIFYVAGCAVVVSWNAGDREWNVNDWELDDDFWDAGHRVFSRNN